MTFGPIFGSALALRAQKNPVESIRYFQAAVAIRPDSAIAYNHLGLALTDLRRVDDAIEMFQAAERLDRRRARSVPIWACCCHTGSTCRSHPRIAKQHQPQAGRCHAPRYLGAV